MPKNYPEGKEAMPEKELLKIDELSKYLRTTPLTLYRMVERGEIPFLRVGRSIRFEKSKIDDWLAWGKL